VKIEVLTTPRRRARRTSTVQMLRYAHVAEQGFNREDALPPLQFIDQLVINRTPLISFERQNEYRT
jgi:hypothetical protein